jgi:hypothetical protein
VVLVALSLAFANVASAAMSPAGAHHAHCHATESAAKHRCGDPHAACCAAACDCASSADLVAPWPIALASGAIARDFPLPSSRIVAARESRPLRPPIA